MKTIKYLALALIAWGVSLPLSAQIKHEIKPLSLMLQGENYAFILGYEHFLKPKLGAELGLAYYTWYYYYRNASTTQAYLGPSIALRGYPWAKQNGGGFFLSANSFFGLSPDHNKTYNQNQLINSRDLPKDYLQAQLRQRLVFGLGVGYKLILWRFAIEASVQQATELNTKYIEGATWDKGPGYTLRLGYRFK
jgi:hypothetical protein